MSEPCVVTAAIMERDGRFLIARRAPQQKHAGGWEFPGGKLEDNETPEECLAREIREELAIEADIGELFARTLYEYASGAVLLLAYRVTSYSGEFRLLVHDELCFALPNEILTFDLLPADRPIAELLAGNRERNKLD